VRIVDDVGAVEREEAGGELGVVEADDLAEQEREREEDDRSAAHEQELHHAPHRA